MKRLLSGLPIAAAGLACLAVASEAPPATGDALSRPTVMVRHAERTVLLSAAQAGERIVAVGERGVITLSDDGGRTWRQAVVPVSVTLTAVRFVDTRRGWAVGHAGVVLATEDGGEHWQLQLDGHRAAALVLEDARASGDAHVIAAAQQLVADGADKPFLDILLMSGDRLLAVGAYGLALVSTDGGRSWTSWTSRLPNAKGLHLYAVRQRGDVIVIAGEQGLALSSNDGGRTFRALVTSYKGSFFSAEIPADGEIVLAGLRGNAFRSIDDGVSWSPIAAPMAASITATALTSDGRVMAVNQAGFVMSLLGDRMVPSNRAPLPPLNGVLPLGAGRLLVLSVAGALSVEQGMSK